LAISPAATSTTVRAAHAGPTPWRRPHGRLRHRACVRPVRSRRRGPLSGNRRIEADERRGAPAIESDSPRTAGYERADNSPFKPRRSGGTVRSVARSSSAPPVRVRRAVNAQHGCASSRAGLRPAPGVRHWLQRCRFRGARSLSGASRAACRESVKDVCRSRSGRPARRPERRLRVRPRRRPLAPERRARGHTTSRPVRAVRPAAAGALNRVSAAVGTEGEASVRSDAHWVERVRPGCVGRLCRTGRRSRRDRSRPCRRSGGRGCRTRRPSTVHTWRRAWKRMRDAELPYLVGPSVTAAAASACDHWSRPRRRARPRDRGLDRGRGLTEAYRLTRPSASSRCSTSGVPQPGMLRTNSAGLGRTRRALRCCSCADGDTIE
jgi:hypothetical protein